MSKTTLILFFVAAVLSGLVITVLDIPLGLPSEASLGSTPTPSRTPLPSPTSTITPTKTPTPTYTVAPSKTPFPTATPIPFRVFADDIAYDARDGVIECAPTGIQDFPYEILPEGYVVHSVSSNYCTVVFAYSEPAVPGETIIGFYRVFQNLDVVDVHFETILDEGFAADLNWVVP